MKKNWIIISLSLVLFSMIACEPTSDTDLDEKLNFSKLSVEAQKQKIEEQGLEFVNALAGLQETQLFQVVEYFAELSEDNFSSTNGAMKILKYDLEKQPKKALSNFNKQMRVISEEDEDFWGEYVYNFEKDSLEKINTLTNSLIVKFPSSAEATTNDGLLTFNYTESDVRVPESEEYYPSEASFSVKVGSNTLISANMTGTYYNEGIPKKVNNSLKIDDFEWSAEVDNNQSKATTTYEFKKGSLILIKTNGEVRGKLTKDEIETAFENDRPEDALEYVAASGQVMNIGVKVGMKDMKAFFIAMRNADNEKLTQKERKEAEAKAFNDYLIATAYFAKEKEKFADVKVEVVEKRDSYYDWDYEKQEVVEVTYVYYDTEPIFVLSDGSKVSPEKYIQHGFDDLFNRIEEIIEPFVYTEEYTPNIIYPESI